ncbi:MULTISPECIES: cell division topological specificity factor MinE [Burkholderia]|jgi:cell division topological specificity factor|uniref:Cell division topological specificity factor n=16 Tax=Burkholderia TaxID=32008 RepID=MINE_BURO0|nr:MULTISPECIES: cell division topological specificity factor MinE [Burkholderia]A0K5G1.1 RecName: Full=Cell division topological specificity factor [Burkholderia cenocepacia HI2424]B1JXA3.1 RecName: Full=Cell division topological specificity factor [Burkholderia orbicola MC0-3]Q1BY87.1 RecName: Full=Cell division topological specificity factor [Burkholderia orbicola AU 1054]ALX12680.1 cell division topological specificity factor MinE [Burkholderia cepacia JBK9]EAY62547.1 Septum formation topo
MSILSFLLGEKKKSASVAKERLQLIIAHERVGGRPPADYLPALQKELVAVISKYVHISDDDIRVSLERQDDLEVLEVKIEIPQA